ncbi:MAG: nickel-responsive transcriptional regulator NikR [Oligoflexia bacterium]|nr:nickel-responsive transcriptional regulator NikR [Oligoflexia bacterium]
MRRYAISINDDLANKFEDYLKKEKYANRSVAISNIMASVLAESSWHSNLSNKVAATISLVYDHHKGPVIKKLNDLQHDYHTIIRCTQHVHVSHSDCLEVIICAGTAKDIKIFYDKLKKIKPIKLHSISVLEYSDEH